MDRHRRYRTGTAARVQHDGLGRRLLGGSRSRRGHGHRRSELDHRHQPDHADVLLRRHGGQRQQPQRALRRRRAHQDLRGGDRRRLRHDLRARQRPDHAQRAARLRRPARHDAAEPQPAAGHAARAARPRPRPGRAEPEVRAQVHGQLGQSHPAVLPHALRRHGLLLPSVLLRDRRADRESSRAQGDAGRDRAQGGVRAPRRTGDQQHRRLHRPAAPREAGIPGADARAVAARSLTGQGRQSEARRTRAAAGRPEPALLPGR